MSVFDVILIPFILTLPSFLLFESMGPCAAKNPVVSKAVAGVSL